MKNGFIYVCLLLFCHATFAAQQIAFDTPLMSSMLDNSTAFNNDSYLINAKERLSTNTFYIGGYAQGGFSYVTANGLTRIYTNNLTYRTRSYFSLDRTALAAFGNLTPWWGVYLEVGANDIGETYNSGIGINQFYLLLRNTNFPMYAFVGYKNIDFGNFSTVNIFAQPTTRWDYAGTALTAGAGYLYKNFNFTFSLLKPGTQGAEDYYGAGLWRVHIYPNYYTNHVPNFAFNAVYQIPIEKLKWNVGAGYIRGLWLGSPANSFTNSNIGAWDINSQIYYNQWTFLTEYVQSTPRTSSFGAFTPTGSNHIFLKTWDLGIAYTWHNFLLPNQSQVSADVSSIIGNTSIAEATQYVFGVSNQIFKNVKAGLEYVLVSQKSGEGAKRSGLFYREHHVVQAIRLDLTAGF